MNSRENTVVEIIPPREYPLRVADLAEFTRQRNVQSPSLDPRWPLILRAGLRHVPYAVTARRDGQLRGVLPLCLVRSALFGRFLVGLPYLNTGGVLLADGEDAETAAALVDRAVTLAEELDVRHLELRHEAPVEHPALAHQMTGKVHMRLPLPDDADALWASFKPKVRNQVRKAEKLGLTVQWGTRDQLDAFYRIFARNMRDLGTPVFSKRLFAAVLSHLPEQAELCLVRRDGEPLAAGLLVHGPGVTEVPSASSLRKYNATNANMLLYWHLLRRALERGQEVFDFGRSTVDSNTFRFKRQWGAIGHPAVWQYHQRKGSMTEVRPDNPKYQNAIRLWQRLPVWFTRIVGPAIVRGIP